MAVTNFVAAIFYSIIKASLPQLQLQQTGFIIYIIYQKT